MEQKYLKVEKIEKELQNFQRQHLHQNQKGIGKKSSCGGSSSCAANVLVEKLLKILENEEEAEIGAEIQTSPEQKALSNTLVVREILGYMNIFSLLKFRQVSRLWKEEATSILLPSKPENNLCLRFEWWFDREEFCNAEMYSLSDFMKAFRDNWGIFQFVQLIFTGGQMNEPALVQFFSKYGNHVEHLGLFPEFVTSFAEATLLGNIIFKWTPNLKSLALEQNVLEIEQRQNQSYNKLPNLRELILPKPARDPQTNDPQSERPQSPLLREILTSAPNLTSIQDDHLAFISQITAEGKSSLVKALSLSRGYTRFDSGFFQFVTAGPQLRSLKVEPCFFSHGQPNPEGEACCSVLRQCQNTLEFIQGADELVAMVDPSSQLQLPPLPRVTQFKLMARGAVDRRILPRGNTLSQVFPNLKSMHVEIQGGGLYTLTSPLNAHPGLKKMTISPYDPNADAYITFEFNFVEQVSTLYPNITHLHFDLHTLGVDKLPEGLGLISGSFEQLEELILEIRIKKETPVKFKRDMDHDLSGLPWELCEQLWSSREPNPKYQKLEVLEKIRVAPSIVDLKKLTNLTFVVYFEKSPQPIWTHLAEFYAFQPMTKRQGLEVNIRTSQNQSFVQNRSDLRPVEPL